MNPMLQADATMPGIPGKKDLQHCPRCKSDKIYSSRTRSKWEVWRKEITGKRVYRCHECDWRGWGPDTGPHFSREQIDSSVIAIADAPNLKDTLLARGERRSRDIDLGKLDEAFPVRQDAAEKG
jgi:hypothetical protein